MVFCTGFYKITAWKKQFNVLGALDAITKEIITVVNETYINAQSVCDLIEGNRKTKFRHPH